MLILLPPSEGKTPAHRGRPLDLGMLSFPELAETRVAVATALTAVSGAADAAERLRVTPSLTPQIGRNSTLLTAPAAAAGRVYSGVLYDALDLASLDTAARRRANRWLVVVSALFGALRMGDRIPAYRLSMAVNLPPLGPLASVWRPSLDGPLTEAAGRAAVVDCRSTTYVGAWVPRGATAKRWVRVRVPGATHQAKHTRGLVARHLCQAGWDARSPQAVAEVLSTRFDIELHAPQRAASPWVLDVRTVAAGAASR